VRILLDTHVLLDVLGETSMRLPVAMRALLNSPDAVRIVSVASLWEVAIKVRRNRLPVAVPLDGIPARIERINIRLLDVTAGHVVRDVEPVPPTADPFDRLLLAVAAAEGARLLTVDSKLVDHPLAWRPA
jgi:PIN domain nuclease of toxin-antitoxin system